jgi:hypothetical protein
VVAAISTGDSLQVRVDYAVTGRVQGLCLGIALYTADLQLVYDWRSSDANFMLPNTPGQSSVRLTIPRIRLLSGIYSIRAYLLDESGACHSNIDPAAVLEVAGGAAPPHASGPYARHALATEEAAWSTA